MALVTFEQAQGHLRCGTEDRDDVELKIEQSSAIVLRLIRAPDDDWNEDTDPFEDPSFAIVQAAILEVLANMYRHRGDDDKPADGPLTPRVLAMLQAAGLMDPTLA